MLVNKNVDNSYQNEGLSNPIDLLARPRKTDDGHTGASQFMGGTEAGCHSRECRASPKPLLSRQGGTNKLLLSFLRKQESRVWTPDQVRGDGRNSFELEKNFGNLCVYAHASYFRQTDALLFFLLIVFWRNC
jgi:hypothetical protein